MKYLKRIGFLLVKNFCFALRYIFSSFFKWFAKEPGNAPHCSTIKNQGSRA